jgi:pilus assembly protein CpaB
MAEGQPITRAGIVKPGDREFLHVVLSPGARAINVPMGMTSGLLFPGDRVDVILTQTFKGDDTPLTRRSVGETVVENLRVLAIDNHNDKSTVARLDQMRTITLEVMPEQAEKVNVAAELGKLSLTLRSTIDSDNQVASSTPGPGTPEGVKPTWAGDVSPALKKATPPPKVVAAEKPTVRVLRGSKSETVKE